MNEVVASRDWVGRTIDNKFNLLLWLGESGDGGVFLTELEGPGSKNAVIKLIPAADIQADTQIATWAAASKLSHPNLLKIYRWGRVDNPALLYVVMEYAEEVLAQLIPERPLTPGETREMLGPVFEATAYLHGKGLVHGRIKPSNILVVDNVLKISSDTVQSAGSAGGRLAKPSIYDAPERPSKPLAPAADIWSLGVTIMAALTQRPPVWDRTAKTDPMVPVSLAAPFQDMVREALRVDPARRASLARLHSILDPSRPAVAPTPATVVAAGPSPAKPTAAPAKPTAGSAKPTPPAAKPVSAVSPAPNVASSKPVPVEPFVETAEPAPRSNSGTLRMIVIAAILLIVVAAIVAFARRSHNDQQGSEAAAVPSPQSAPQASQPAPTPAPPANANTATTNGDVVNRVMPDVSEGARRTIRGTIKIRVAVAVDATGSVTSAKVENSHSSRYFVRLAQQAAEQWKFKPAQANGQPVPSDWVLHFEFRRSGDKVEPVPSRH